VSDNVGGPRCVTSEAGVYCLSHTSDLHVELTRPMTDIPLQIMHICAYIHNVH